MAASMGMGSGEAMGNAAAGGSGGLASMLGGGDMSKAMSDPKFLESAMSMMRGMDEESLTSMMMSSGMCGSKDQAQAMAKQVSAVYSVLPSLLSTSFSPALSPLTDEGHDRISDEDDDEGCECRTGVSSMTMKSTHRSLWGKTPTWMGSDGNFSTLGGGEQENKQGNLEL
jgi:hypothetical protein